MTLREFLQFVNNAILNGSVGDTEKVHLLLWDAESAEYVQATGAQWDGYMNLRVYRDGA